MIDININMDQYGRGNRIYGLARIVIWNDGSGDGDHGNYLFAVSHQFNSPHGSEAAGRTGRAEPTVVDLVGGGPWVWKSGAIRSYPRRLGAVRLLGRALKKANLT